MKKKVKKEGRKERKKREGVKEKKKYLSLSSALSSSRISSEIHDILTLYIPDNDNRDHKILNYT